MTTDEKKKRAIWTAEEEENLMNLINKYAPDINNRKTNGSQQNIRNEVNFRHFLINLSDCNF